VTCTVLALGSSMQATNGGLIYVTWGSSEEMTIAGLRVRPQGSKILARNDDKKDSPAHRDTSLLW
jgi:hypothetical protein